MAGNYDTIQNRPNDAERKTAHENGTGGYGGEDTKNPELRIKSFPKAEA